MVCSAGGENRSRKAPAISLDTHAQRTTMPASSIAISAIIHFSCAGRARHHLNMTLRL